MALAYAIVRFLTGPLLLLSLGATAGLTGCGTGGLFGQAKKSYTITVTATSGGLVRNSTVQLTLQ
jgi:hypothetical protein